jgi:hypothetical protein
MSRSWIWWKGEGKIKEWGRTGRKPVHSICQKCKFRVHGRRAGMVVEPFGRRARRASRVGWRMLRKTMCAYEQYSKGPHAMLSQAKERI